MIDQATIDRILDAAQIVDVVSDFVTLRKRGVNYEVYARSMTTKHRRSTYRLPKDCASASPAERRQCRTLHHGARADVLS